jgi:hypothetical protein
MATADIMTDFQFKALINMVIDIVSSKEDKAAIIKTLEAIRDGKDVRQTLSEDKK